MIMVLPAYVVKWTTDDTATLTVAGLEHELVVYGTEDLAKLLRIISINPFRSLSVEPSDQDQVTTDG